MSDVLEVAERALAAAGEPDALARVTDERSLVLRFARSRPTQATSVDDVTVEICVLRDGHVGSAETNSTDDGALRRCAAAARESADATARSGRRGNYPGFPSASAHAPVPGTRDSSGLAAKAAGDAVTAAIDACAAEGVEAYGTWTSAVVDTAVASGAGGAVAESITDAFMKVTAISRADRSGYASAAAPRAAALDPRALARRASAKAGAGGEVQRLAAGTYPVVLAADAVADLVAWLGATAFNGLEHAEGRGALSGRLGTRVCAANINLADSPAHPRTIRRSFDSEGVAKAPLPLIEDGVARNVVHDVRSAAVGGARSTGHALAPGGTPQGPRPTNLVLAGGGSGDETELCRPIDHGVYVTRLWYTNPVRPKETLITGVTRDGTFLIEGGEITRPLADMRMTDSVLRVFDCCEDMTAATALTSDGEFYGRRFATGVVCPALRSQMRFTA